MSWARTGRRQIVYIKQETTPGTYAYPSAADAIPLSGDPSFDEAKVELALDVQRAPTRGRNQAVVLGYGPLTFGGRVPIKPKGASQHPVGYQILQGLLGKSPAAGQYRLHDPTADLPTWTVVFQVADGVFWFAGAVFDRGAFNIATTGDNAVLQCEWSGVALKVARAWMSTLRTALSGGAGGTTYTTIPVDEPTNFTVDALVWFDVAATVANPDNGGQGYRVTAVNVSTKEITISPGVQVLANQTMSVGTPIRPFVPTPTDAGQLVSWRLGWVSQKQPADASYVNLPVVGGSIEVRNNVQALTEKQDTLFPTKLIAGTREVDVQLELLLTKAVAGHLDDPVAGRVWQLRADAGNQTGYTVRFACPRLWPTESTMTKGIDVLRMTRQFVALESSTGANDEITIDVV